MMKNDRERYLKEVEVDALKNQIAQLENERNNQPENDLQNIDESESEVQFIQKKSNERPLSDFDKHFEKVAPKTSKIPK